MVFAVKSLHKKIPTLAFQYGFSTLGTLSTWQGYYRHYLIFGKCSGIDVLVFCWPGTCFCCV